jgi:hypothetical protein
VPPAWADRPKSRKLFRLRILAGAIALPQRHADPMQAGGPSPRPAPPRPRRALTFRGAGCTGPGGSVQRGRGNAVRFLFPPKGAIRFPGSGRVSRRAGGRIAFSAPCSHDRCQRLVHRRFLRRSRARHSVDAQGRRRSRDDG